MISLRFIADTSGVTQTQTAMASAQRSINMETAGVLERQLVVFDLAGETYGVEIQP